MLWTLRVQNLSCAQMIKTLTLFIGVLKYSLFIENLGYSMVIGSEDDCHGKVSLLQFPRGGDTAHGGWGCKEKRQTWSRGRGRRGTVGRSLPCGSVGRRGEAGSAGLAWLVWAMSVVRSVEAVPRCLVPAQVERGPWVWETSQVSGWGWALDWLACEKCACRWAVSTSRNWLTWEGQSFQGQQGPKCQSIGIQKIRTWFIGGRILIPGD